MLKIIFADITNYMGKYFIKSVLLGVICSVLLFVVLNLMKKSRKYDGSEIRIVDKTIAFFLGIVYAYMVIGITFLCREPIFEQVISFRPFSAPVGNPRLWAYLVENIIMFIPYGMLIPILFGYFEKWYRCLFLGIISSLVIETAQFISARGKPQIDDIMLNTSGMMIGWLLFSLIARSYRMRKLK